MYSLSSIKSVLLLALVLLLIVVVVVVVHQGNPHIREGRALAPARPRMQAAGLQRPKLQIAAAFSRPASPRISWYAGFLENPVAQNTTQTHGMNGGLSVLSLPGAVFHVLLR